MWMSMTNCAFMLYMSNVSVDRQRHVTVTSCPWRNDVMMFCSSVCVCTSMDVIVFLVSAQLYKLARQRPMAFM